MADRYRCAVLGATGIVGQRFISMLEGHPWFEVVALAASERSAGRRYTEACRWHIEEPMPEWLRDAQVVSPDDIRHVDLVFSALPSQAAGPVEEKLAERLPVFSKASAHRRDSDVPVIVPEVNWEHWKLVEQQRRYREGFIAADPNCTTCQMVLALKPLERYGIRKVSLVSMQALSGAGYPGHPAYDLTDNVVPYIAGEEEKVEYETRKIFGRLEDSEVRPADISVSASCNRVNVLDGHTECISVELAEEISPEEAASAMSSYRGKPQELGLPTAPERPVVVLSAEDRPQPRRDRNNGNGMAVAVGRLRGDAVLTLKFVCVGHNTVRGAAGNGILNAEMFRHLGVV